MPDDQKPVVVISTWLRLFPALRSDGRRTGRYSRYTPHINLITGRPHSHARENARRLRQMQKNAPARAGKEAA